MKEKQYLCKVELYVEDGKICADYAHNSHGIVAEQMVLHLLENFVGELLDDIYRVGEETK